MSAADFRERNVQHAVARAWAAYGHVLAAQERLHAQARQHAHRVSRRTGSRDAEG